jgi:hydrogenase-4 membrane subunit HyfE
MDTTSILHFVSESIYLISVFCIFLTIAIWKGRQTIINLICGLYFALLISSQFPYYDIVLKDLTESTVIAAAKLVIFILFTFLSTWLFKRIMPEEYREGKFETFHKKILLACAATILVMLFSFSILPVTEFLTPGTPIQSIFAPTQFFFWWLLLPLAVLFFV